MCPLRMKIVQATGILKRHQWIKLFVTTSLIAWAQAQNHPCDVLWKRNYFVIAPAKYAREPRQ